MAYVIPPLPFPKKALEPFISKETMDLHYDKHHQGYVDHLNALILDTPLMDLPLTEILMKSGGTTFNQAAQVWNHNFYWQSLRPKSGAPTGDLLQAMRNSFSSLDRFYGEFKKAASAQFGSGWAWLVLGRSGALSIETTSNADNPILHGKTPLLTIDLWEHAYYLDYKNERERYLDSVENLLNWEFAEASFKAAGRPVAG